mmetsp:Transcript_29381/g.61465  ORF Transcript_29381/g.61465 Transcript_29381/m.61465 type:complete len:204 (+) Transcript_29381:122-733(+)
MRCLLHLLSIALYWTTVRSYAYDEVTLMWREDEPVKKKHRKIEATKPPRKWLSMSKRLSTPTSTQKMKEAPHKLRTDEWMVTINWNPFFKRRKNHADSMSLEFAANGFVREINNQTDLAIGKWSSSVNGVSWNLETEKTDLWFHAQLLLNPFGSQPKLIRGVILDKSRVWFRPVVGTFSAAGTGIDTTDFSYQRRRSKQSKPD